GPAPNIAQGNPNTKSPRTTPSAFTSRDVPFDCLSPTLSPFGSGSVEMAPSGDTPATHLVARLHHIQNLGVRLLTSQTSSTGVAMYASALRATRLISVASDGGVFAGIAGTSLSLALSHRFGRFEPREHMGRATPRTRSNPPLAAPGALPISEIED